VVAADWTHIYAHWQTYALAACGLASVFLAQNAFHAGPIAASQTALVMVDPLASLAIGIGLFSDDLRTAGIYGPLEPSRSSSCSPGPSPWPGPPDLGAEGGGRPVRRAALHPVAVRTAGRARAVAET